MTSNPKHSNHTYRYCTYSMSTTFLIVRLGFVITRNLYKKHRRDLGKVFNNYEEAMEKNCIVAPVLAYLPRYVCG